MGLSWHSIKLASAATCFLLVASDTVAEAQSGLLLGLRRECDEERCETAYRTLWIASRAGTLQIMELPELIVPRKTGFWRVGVRSYCHPKGTKYDADYDIWSDVVLFAKPVSQRPIIHGLLQCPEPAQTPNAAQRSCDDIDEDVDDGIDVQFVNGDYISLRKWARNGPCSSTVDGSDFWNVQRLGDSADRATRQNTTGDFPYPLLTGPRMLASSNLGPFICVGPGFLTIEFPVTSVPMVI